MVEIGGERHAIRVLLSYRYPESVRQMIETNIARYDALIVFAEERIEGGGVDLGLEVGDGRSGEAVGGDTSGAAARIRRRS